MRLRPMRPAILDVSQTGRVVTVKAAPAGPQALQPGTEPVKEFQYKDGDKITPVEC
jgi:hypothetical protein